MYVCCVCWLQDDGSSGSNSSARLKQRDDGANAVVLGSKDGSKLVLPWPQLLKVGAMCTVLQHRVAQ